LILQSVLICIDTARLPVVLNDFQTLRQTNTAVTGWIIVIATPSKMFETRVIRQLNVTAKDDIIFIFILPTRSNIYTAV